MKKILLFIGLNLIIQLEVFSQEDTLNDNHRYLNEICEFNFFQQDFALDSFLGNKIKYLD